MAGSPRFARWTMRHRLDRRRLGQLAAGGVGVAFLTRAGVRRQPDALARDDDEHDDSDSSSGHGRGRGRGRGRGGRDDTDDNRGPGNEDDDDLVVPAGAIPEGSTEIRIVSDDAGGFVPGEVTIDAGQTVTFVNAHDDEHTATGSGFDTGIIAPGTMTTVTLETPGRYAYACQIHPEMTGTVNVRGADGAVPLPRGTPVPASENVTAVSIVDLAFSPAEVRMRPGGSVVWTNNDTVPHTVTAADGAFDSGIFDPGSSFSWPFDQPGAFAYACQLHPQMQGTIIVEGEPLPATPAAAATPSGAN